MKDIGVKNNLTDFIITPETGDLLAIGEPEENYFPKDKYPYQDQMYQLIGACMEVHRVLGKGFLESVYHEALCLELTQRQIPFEADKLLHIEYKGIKLQKTFKADIFAYGHIILEEKAIDGPLDPHHGQVINYLRASGLLLGLLVNFGTPSLQYRRFIFTRNLNSYTPPKNL